MIELISLMACVVGLVLWHQSKKKKQKQNILRSEARKNYSMIKEVVVLWGENKSDPSLTKAALQALAVHAERQEALMFGHIMNGMNAEKAVYLDEYRAMLHEDELALKYGSGFDSRMKEVRDFQSALVDLRGLAPSNL